jgi:hypothetical protein
MASAPLQYESQTRAPLVEGPKDYHQVTEDIVRPIEAAPSRLWWIGFLISVACLIFGIWSVTEQVIYGVGQWNLHRTVGWGWDITNFVWWVGIGHAGTLISAILLLFRQGWRYVRGSVSDLAHGSRLVVLLYHALPQHARPALAQLQLSTALGRVRYLDVFHCIAALLVYRSDPRYGYRPGPRQA